ncbi:hypothetical protein CH289_17660 [Rhodococcus sp. RS1C4]|uniref:TY-Chap domain-containing protein n=1 Tax=Rhodococcus sp. 14-2470-1a TaxID=2023150 RepID=UPI000B9BD5E1|nr:MULTISPECIES: hypothetical protein [unclassified Rhodococcus (in: high G+C Gram-positive bacteria)]OZC49356.1 hypothetical protein CH289_17660 [Rhodococcus sp. RS1C4]OZF52520.1 hypothetical protein CH292_10305 [Rhodococcus sp. 14-2470-1a]
MIEDPDFDTEVNTSWTVFAARLGRYLDGMRAPQTLTLLSDSVWQVSGLSVVLAKDRDLVDAVAHVPRSLLDARTAEERTTLAYARWRASPARSHSDGTELRISGNGTPIARTVMTLFRDFGRISHPSFLALDATGASPGWILDGSRARTDDDLTSRVFAVLGPVAVDRLVRDAHIRVLDDEAVVEYSATYTGEPPTPASILRLAESWPDMAFRVSPDAVAVVARVDCSPLVEEHLVRKTRMFLRFLDEAGARLTNRESRSASRRR